MSWSPVDWLAISKGKYMPVQEHDGGGDTITEQ